jgi:hypothetical protein
MKNLAIRLILFFLIPLIFGCVYAYEISDSEIPNVPNKNEIVMNKGMKITATTPEGTIIITAGYGLKRSYTWEGETRSIIMWPRGERWYGSMGLYYPGPGNHWKEHNGITRGVVQEGQHHFDTAEEALEWLKLPRYNSCVHNNNGLVVCYSKALERQQLNVDVWQIFIGGKIISEYQEDTKRIEEDWRIFHERFLNVSEYARLKKICHVGGEKPKSLPGSQDEEVKVEFIHE